jgi:hypothetical protein
MKNQSDIGSKLKKEIPAPAATVRAGNKNVNSVIENAASS